MSLSTGASGAERATREVRTNEAQPETPAASASPAPAPPPTKTCTHCQKPEQTSADDDDDDTSKPALKQCAKCHTAAYCNKECQKADFKAHKKVCAQLAQAYVRDNEPGPMASRAPPRTGTGQRGLQKWQFDT